mgnify:CR=1 FL=1
MLKIETSKGVLDLGGELSLQVEEKSPVMNERGSQSLPATVPSTARNMLIMGFPHRLDGVEVPLAGDKSCTVSDGVYHRRGVMNLVSASRREGITFNVGFDNSEAYEAWKKRKLNELSLPVRGDGDVEDLAGLLQGAYDNGGGDDLAVFPIAVAREEISSDNVNTVYWGLLNRVDSNGKLVWRARTQEQPVDGTVMNVSLPSGYGVTAFLYVWRVLELAFADLGYEIESNPFKGADAGDLAQLVVLNNVADAICTGYLNYSDLMPDCEVQAFLQALKVRFGLVYLLNQDTHRVRLELVRDIIVKEPDLDITQWQAERPMVAYETRKQLKLTAKTSLFNAAPSTERLEDYTKGLSFDYLYTVEAWTSEPPIGSDLIREQETGKLYKWDSSNNAYTDNVSGFFDWDPQTEGVEVEELSSEDECVPMLKVENVYLPGYITGAVHHHSYIRGHKTEKETGETPMAFVISYGKRGRITPPLNATGERLSLLFQWEDGLYERFWSGYDDLLRRAFNKVEATMSLSAVNLLGLDLLQPVKYQGQALLIDGFDYMLPIRQNIKVTMILRTLKKRGDIAAGQIAPSVGPTIESWRWVFMRSDLDEQVENKRQELIRTYGSGTLVEVLNGDAHEDDPYFDIPPTGPGSVTRDYIAQAHFVVRQTVEQGWAQDVDVWENIQYQVTYRALHVIV